MLHTDGPALFRTYLLGGERVLWTGQPRQGIILRPSDAGLIPFSMLWGGFALFWNATVWAIGAPLFFRLWGLPFLVMGLYIMAGRFWHDAHLRKRLYYAVTDQRILFLRAGRSPKFSAREIGYLPVLELEERGDGRGSINFEPRIFGWGSWQGNGWGIWVPALSASGRFDQIDHPRTVYELIRGRV